MKKIFIILLVVFTFSSKIYAESTTCPAEEGYTIIECFDNQETGTSYTTVGGASTATVIETTPASSDNKALLIALTNNNQKVSFNISLPCENSLASYDKLIFKIYVTEQYKQVRCWIDNTKIAQSSNLTLNTWVTVEFSLTSLDAELKSKTSFTLDFGFESDLNNGKSFYIDDIKLQQESSYKPCPIADPEKDATLSSLSITPGTLTPEFKSTITSYTVNVANEVEYITIEAEAAQAEASVSGTGMKPLDIGENPFTVKVVAPDETTTQEYTILVTRADENVSCDTEFDFENDATTYNGSNVKDIAIFDNSITTGNSSAKALKFTVTNYNAVIKLPVKEGKLSDNYIKIEFDVAVSAIQYGKSIVFGASTDGNTFSSENKNVKSFTGDDQTIYNDKWRTLSIEISDLGTSVKDKTGTLWFGLGVNDNANTYYFDNIKLIAKDGTCPKTYRWTPADESAPTGWEVETNWTPNGVPGSLDKVIIPPSASYPSLPENTQVSSIVFQPGAEIANQHYLTGNYKAYVQYDFGSEDTRDRWHMLSIPLSETFVGDFTFGGYPRTFFLPFGENGWKASNTFSNDKELTAGDAFLFWVEDATYSAEAEKGLGKKNGILEIPFFESDFTKGSGVHPNHEFNSSQSIFYNYKKEDDEYVNSEQSVTADRTADAYKLAGETVSVPLVFAHDDSYNSDFALVGNPFMSTIDFTALATLNTTQIKNNYQVWTRKDNAFGFAGYHPEGEWGLSSEATTTKYIAPLQAFFVEKSIDYKDGNLEFNISVSATGEGTLRNSVNTNNKLEITASNETASVLAFIAQRPGGQTIVGNADARKMLNGVSDLPEVYTLKPTANGSIAVLGANIIPAGEVSVPVGLFTSHTGAMNLTFKGMDSYENTTITLIDNAIDNKEIDLTGLSSYRYDFNFEPAMAGNEILPVEDRFAVRFAPSTPTGVHTPSVSVSVYSKNQAIHIVSDASNLIKQIQIYNAQGILVYTGDQVNTSSYTVDYPANTGVCIVKVITRQGIKNVKLIK